MAYIDSKLLKDFARSTNDTKRDKNGTTVYGTVVRSDGVDYVRIDGSDQLTPIIKAVNASPGNRVKVVLKDHTATITGNITSPPTDDTQAIIAQNYAIIAQEKADEAESAAIAANASASQAQAKAAEAETAANQAQAKAEEAETAANQAQEKAEEATASAAAANASASRANIAANGALSQLSVVEDVVGTLNWISEHGTYSLTADTEVVPGKHYFEKVGDSYNIVISPTGNPSTQGYYELSGIDEAVSNFVATHLSVTNAGLWVINDNSSYKVLLASDGMKVYDPNGVLVASFGESISFSSTRPQYIGGEEAFIIFYDSDNDGVPDAINIGGSKVTLGGSKRLSDLLTSLDISTRQTSDGAEITVAGQTVSLKDGADAAVLRIDSSRGNVFKNSQVSTVLTVTIYIGSERITNITSLRARFGARAYLQWYWQRIGDSSYSEIVASDPKLSDNGFSLTLTPADVDTKVTFRCELNV